MQNPFLPYIKGIESAFQNARGLEVTGERKINESTKKILLFSPHPDDESIQGLLPLRLQIERNFQVINVPVTHGSMTNRRAERAQELKNACKYLGWECYYPRQDLSNLDTRDILTALETFRPKAIILPHSKDWNSRHTDTHNTVMDSLRQVPDFTSWIFETEFWGELEEPNCMVAGSAEQVAELVAATSFHTGEVMRNPYHLRLPAWMQENVRRGSERISGQGSTAPDFTFATLYRAHFRKDGKLCENTRAPKQIGIADSLSWIG